MAALQGYLAKVSIGASKILGISRMQIQGIRADQIEKSQFGDTWKSFMIGQKDGGTVSFSGYLDLTDTTGQNFLRLANISNTNVTDIRFYINNTSYYEPDQTGQASYINVVGWNVSAEVAGRIDCDFELKVSGQLVLV